MSNQCIDCGTVVANYKVHAKTQKCTTTREFNSKFLYKCRKCGLQLEKQWHAESHRCNGVKVYDAEVEELQLKCKFYSEFISALGIPLPVDWDKVKNGTFTTAVPPRVQLVYDKSDDESSESETESSESETESSESETESSESETESSESDDETPMKSLEDLKEPFSPPEVFKESFLPSLEPSKEFFEDILTFKGLNSMLLLGNRVSTDGEDRFYILGNKLGEFMSREYPRNTDEKMLTVFDNFQLLVSKISNTIDEREQFINGLNDSFCGSNILAYILINLGMFDQSLRFDFKGLLASKGHIECISLLSIPEIVKSFSLVYATLPIEDFITNVLIDSKTNRYSHSSGQFYRLEQDGYHVDAWMLDLTSALSSAIIDIGVPLFRKVYKAVYGNNNYSEGWMNHPFLKQFVQVYRNVELATVQFDLNHIIRKKILATTPKDIPVMRTSVNRNEEWALLSTRVHNGIPAYEFNNFLESLFEANSVIEVSSKWMKRYLSGLKSYKTEYIPSPRFKAQVASELKQFV